MLSSASSGRSSSSSSLSEGRKSGTGSTVVSSEGTGFKSSDETLAAQQNVRSITELNFHQVTTSFIYIHIIPLAFILFK